MHVFSHLVLTFTPHYIRKKYRCMFPCVFPIKCSPLPLITSRFNSGALIREFTVGNHDVSEEDGTHHVINDVIWEMSIRTISTKVEGVSHKTHSDRGTCSLMVEMYRSKTCTQLYPQPGESKSAYRLWACRIHCQQRRG